MKGGLARIMARGQKTDEEQETRPTAKFDELLLKKTECAALRRQALARGRPLKPHRAPGPSIMFLLSVTNEMEFIPYSVNHARVSERVSE